MDAVMGRMRASAAPRELRGEGCRVVQGFAPWLGTAAPPGLKKKRSESTAAPPGLREQWLRRALTCP